MKMNLMISVVAVLWIGMILAIGMESVVKFSTPTLTKPVAFDVGRTVFGAFNKAQLVLLAAMMVGACWASLPKWDWAFLTVLALAMAAQIIWLFPILSARVDLILAGVSPPPTSAHAWYGMLEAAKFILLVILAIRLFS
ncbi:hypothetical protein AQUSIP_09620 [Aquicella siphonis]|uniref:DUF4149 domain-containing protein n=1 Tax=Aquicella siphonis TaxID=254247 RepID=A0A5E4PGR7_9COXI|nr:hypothetical protein [Aquicella siphonis]VVC75672.1 hypothetical protein AQUSIP_09620 [Aquicella siphonis]